MIPQRLVGRVRNPTMSCQLPFDPHGYHDPCHDHCHPCQPCPPPCPPYPNDCDGDYAGLSNKPSIEGVTLEGDKTFEQLGLIDIAPEEVKEMYEEIVKEDYINEGENKDG